LFKLTSDTSLALTNESLLYNYLRKTIYESSQAGMSFKKILKHCEHYYSMIVSY